MQFALVLIAIFVLSFAGVNDGRAACIPVPVNCSSINNQTTCATNNCTWEQAESCRSVPGAPSYIRCELHSNRIDCETNTFPYCRWYSTHECRGSGTNQRCAGYNYYTCRNQSTCRWEGVPPCDIPKTSVRDDVKGRICPGDGHWGDFSDWKFCPPGTFAHGYQMRVEKAQGSKKKEDDTALNAIRLACVDRQGSGENTITPHEGWWGDWQDWAYCNGSEPFVGAEMLIEKELGHGLDQDDTAANAVRFECLGGNTIEAPHQVGWGDWKGMSKCPNGQAICGVQVRVEVDQGKDKDDTAMNGARFACCPY